MGVDLFSNLISLEWNKLKKHSIMIEAIIYLFSVLRTSFLFLTLIDFGFNESCESAFHLVNLIHRMAFTLFGASLISQIVIDEYKNKTISIVYSYPIKREKIILAKVLLIFSLLCTATFLLYIDFLFYHHGFTCFFRHFNV
jgi:ABC-type transport system involved in multi-copper enzyme maturation permease subunit